VGDEIGILVGKYIEKKSLRRLRKYDVNINMYGNKIGSENVN
jgi:hypothetical protein